MKKKLIIIGVGLLLALSVTFLLAFKFNKNLTPSETITAFHEKAMSGKVEETKEYIYSDILKGFENGAFWHYGSYGNYIMDYKTKTESVNPDEKTEKITGKTASVDVKITYNNKRTDVSKYYLVKENGAWKIAE